MKRKRIPRWKYYSYINSAAWREVRARFFRSGLYRGFCECCFRRDVPLDVHHKTYSRLGCEKLTDLIALCRRCHDITHAEYEKGDKQTKSGWLRNAHKRARAVVRREKKLQFSASP